MMQIAEKLGSRTPVITNTACGIIGRDAVTNTMREVYFFCWSIPKLNYLTLESSAEVILQVRWHMIPEEDGSNSQEADDFNRGIVLIVGFLPGLKVDTIPLLRPKRVILLP